MTEEKLDTTISIRVTQQTKDLVEARAKQLGIKPSAYALRLLLAALNNTELVVNNANNNVQSVQNIDTTQLDERIALQLAPITEQMRSLENQIRDVLGETIAWKSSWNLSGRSAINSSNQAFLKKWR